MKKVKRWLLELLVEVAVFLSLDTLLLHSIMEQDLIKMIEEAKGNNK